MSFSIVRFVEEDFPVAATCVLRKWYFPARADRQDVPTVLPALSPLRWKGAGSSVGRPTRTTRRCSPLPAFSPLRWKRKRCARVRAQGIRYALPPPHHFGEGA